MNPRIVTFALPAAFASMAFLTSGCAAWISTQSEVAVSSAPDAVFTQKADLGAAFGESGGRIYMEAGGGVGYRPGRDTPHADLHLQLGYERGKAVRWGVGLTANGRFGPTWWRQSDDPTVLEPVNAEGGGGLAGHLIVRVPAESETPAGVYFGVAGSTELVGLDTDKALRLRFVGTIGPMLRYVFDDTTEPRLKL